MNPNLPGNPGSNGQNTQNARPTTWSLVTKGAERVE
jgi:hypothetical protein